MSNVTDLFVDFETFSNVSTSAVIDLALIAFDPNPEATETFEDLVKRGRKIKFNLAEQRNKRLFSKSTIEWWKDQSSEARANLAPSEQDVSTLVGIKQALEYCKSHNISRWKSQAWCRGMSFDFPIFVDLIRDIQRAEGSPENEIDTKDLEPVFFGNQRDVRTAIEAYSLTRGLTVCPLPMGTLNGFIAHDSIHDCAKDILMLRYSKRYALGLEEVPSNPDPLSVKK